MTYFTAKERTAQIQFQHMGKCKECISTFNYTRKERLEMCTWSNYWMSLLMMNEHLILSMTRARKDKISAHGRDVECHHQWWIITVPSFSVLWFTLSTGFLVRFRNWIRFSCLLFLIQDESRWPAALTITCQPSQRHHVEVVMLKVDLPSLGIMQLWTKRTRRRTFWIYLGYIKSLNDFETTYTFLPVYSYSSLLLRDKLRISENWFGTK